MGAPAPVERQRPESALCLQVFEVSYWQRIFCVESIAPSELSRMYTLDWRN